MWNISVWFPNTSAPCKILKTVFLNVCHAFLKIKLREFFFFVLTGLSAWKCIGNFIRGFYTQNNTAFTAHVITNSTYLISHTRPPATSWPVIRNIATQLEMKVQEAVDIDGPMTLWLYIQLYNN